MRGLLRAAHVPRWPRFLLFAAAWVLGCHVQAPVKPPIPEARALPMFDPAAQVEGRPPDGAAASRLAIRDVYPEGVSDGDAVRLRLDRPAVDPSAPPEGVRLRLHRVLPDGSRQEVAADSRFTRADRLELWPLDELPDAHTYEVSLEGRIEGPAGHFVEGTTWRFETPRPELELDVPYGDIAPTEVLFVTPTLPVTPEELAAHLRVRGGDGAEVAVQVRRPTAAEREADEDPAEDARLVIAPGRRWPRGKELKLEVDAGLQSVAGPLPMRQAWSASLRTRPRFAVVGLRCEEGTGDRCPLGPIRIATSTQIRYEDLEKLRVHPPVHDLAQTSGTEWGEDDDGPGQPYVELDGELVAGRRYTITFPASIRDEHDEALGRRRTIEVEVTDVPAPGVASLALSDLAGIYEDADNARVGILAHRVTEVRIRMAALAAEEALEIVGMRDPDTLPWPEPGRVVTLLRRLAPADRGRAVREVLDLSELAAPGRVVLVEVEPVSLTPATRGEPPAVARGVFRISGLAAIAHVGPQRGVLRVTSGTRGTAVAGARVRASHGETIREIGHTDADGLVTLPGARELEKGVRFLVEHGTDAIVLAATPYPWPRRNADLSGRPHPQLWRSRVDRSATLDDAAGGLHPGEIGRIAIRTGRGIYMPGDTVHVAGWAGISTPYGEIASRPVPHGTQVVVELRDEHGDVVLRRRARPNEHGRFVADLALPATARLGRYVVQAQMLGTSHTVSLDVSEARIPTFEVTATPRREELLRGEAIEVDVRASYLSGEAAGMDAARWTFDCSPSWAVPRMEGWSAQTDAEIQRTSWSGELDPKRRATALLELASDALDHRSPMGCTVAVAAQDASLQEAGSSTHLLVHPADRYLAIERLEDVVAGTRPAFGVIALDLRGRRTDVARIDVTVDRIERDERAPILERPVRVASCRLAASGTGPPRTCQLPKLQEGQHRITAEAEVGTRPIQLVRTLWVNAAPPPARRRARRSATAQQVAEPPSKPTAAPPSPPPFAVDLPDELTAGVDAQVTITGPWSTATGVLAVEQTGLRHAIPFVMKDGRADVTVTPGLGQGPTLDVVAHVARPVGEPGRTRVHERSDSAPVREPQRDLQVTIDAPERGRPGRTVPVVVRVRDHAGDPVDARLALWVVDDGLHQLRAPTPVSHEWIFNPDRPGERAITRSLDDLLVPFSPWFGRRIGRAPQVRQASAQVKGAFDPEIRRRFESVPLFAGDVGTGEDGVAELSLPLPDDLTRFRITAIASAALGRTGPMAASGPARFGTGETTIEVSTPLHVRAVLPRALRPGDSVEIAALVSAPVAGEIEATLSLGEGPLAATGPMTRRVSVAKGEVRRIPFAVQAERDGEAKVELVARLIPTKRGKLRRGGVERTLVVAVEPTRVERAAVYGSVASDEAIAIPVRIPAAAHGRHGSVAVSLDASLLGDVGDAVEYLVGYPYGCIEQSASRLLPLVAVRGLGDRGPSGDADVDVLVGETITHILSMQRVDGDFSYWPGGGESAGFAGAYATWVLQLAADRGYPVPSRALARAREAMSRRISRDLPSDGSTRRRELIERTMLLAALASAGEAKPEAFDAAWDHRDDLPTFAQLLLAIALHRAAPEDRRVPVARRMVSALLEERPGVAHVVDPGARWAEYWDSPARDDALALLAMLQLHPDDPRVDKLARGLRDARRGGRWRTTQENAFALLALGDWAARREPEPADSSVRVWIAGRSVLDASIAAFDGPRRGGAVGMGSILGALGTDRTVPVVIDRRGRGRVHYRVGVEWAQADTPPRSQGLSITTRLLDESGEPVTEAIAGRRYVLEVDLHSDVPQRFVAVDVPLAAGLEALEVALGRGQRARLPKIYSSSAWLSHVELKRDRVQIFFDDLPAGAQVHRIPLLATTPGDFDVPGAVAEAMYEPETRGRGESTRLRVRATQR